jgi:signal peptidase II
MNLLYKLIKKTKLFLNKMNIYFILTLLITFTLDRISKIQIINNYSDRKYEINSLINFDLIWNTGIGFGLFSSNSEIIYNIITIFISIVIIILFKIALSSEKIDKFIFSIILGGAFGNFYDRLSYRAVPDFIDLYYSNFHWFTFNVADIFVSLGIIAFLVRGFFIKNDI